MAGHFELRSATNGRFYFNLKAGNGEIILTSGTFPTLDAASAAIELVKANAPIDAQFERTNVTGKQPHFVLKAVNGETLGRSETYSSVTAMENGIKSVMRNAADATVMDLTTFETVPSHK